MASTRKSTRIRRENRDAKFAKNRAKVSRRKLEKMKKEGQLAQ